MPNSGGTTVDVGKYLARIGFEGEPRVDVATLEALQRAHMTAVPFENLHVYHRLGVRTDTAWSLAKIVDQQRGGWCFENNGAFSALLTALGFDVVRFGAAVLLDGPSETVDHLTLEVTIDQPYLVDVGFGASFITPLKLNQAGPQESGTRFFGFVDGPHRVTLTEYEDGESTSLYRFERVRREMSDFDGASLRLQTDPELDWSRKPFATRLIDGGPDRVTLLSNRLKLLRDGRFTETPVPAAEWEATLGEWFAMSSPSAPG